MGITGCSEVPGVRQGSGAAWGSLGGTGSSWPSAVIVTRCPSSAGCSHTMEQSAQASPTAMARGPAKGFCIPSLLPQKPEQRHGLRASARLQAAREGGPTRAWGCPGCFIGGLRAGGPVAGGAAVEWGHGPGSPLLLQLLATMGASWYSLMAASALAQVGGCGESPPSQQSRGHASQPRSLRASPNCPYFG